MIDRHPTQVGSVAETAAAGDRQAAAELLPLVYEELRRLARSWRSRIPPGQTLQTTAIVHESYLRLVGTTDPGWDGRRHFFGAAARSMRQIMVDEARRRGALKRGGDRRRVSLDLAAPLKMSHDDLVALDEALHELERTDDRSHQVVMLRFFAGMTVKDMAQILDVNERTIERDWKFAQAWLQRRLEAD